jgi:hypothetical protein
MEDMISTQIAEAIKKIAPILVNNIPGGGIIAIADEEKIVYKAASTAFNIPSLNEGMPLRKGSGPVKAMKERRQIDEAVPRSVYGTRIHITSLPIIDDDVVHGVLGFIFPRLHPLGRAFYDFAPIITEMFHEGAFVYITDLDKVAGLQGSAKFDLPQWKIGDVLSDNTIARIAIKEKRMLSKDLDASTYGVPVRITSYPCFDEDDPAKVVATFGMILPKKTAKDLQEMSCRLSESLNEISAVIQEMAASASEVSCNEEHLNTNVVEIIEASEKITEVLDFIKQIADQTKMLGLNAAIEAARAGESGHGFGVVAEEIRKLSDVSKSTAIKINGFINEIKQKVEIARRSSELTLRASQEQAAASEEMSASIQEITGMSEQLGRIAETL